MQLEIGKKRKLNKIIVKRESNTWNLEMIVPVRMFPNVLDSQQDFYYSLQ